LEIEVEKIVPLLMLMMLLLLMTGMVAPPPPPPPAPVEIVELSYQKGGA